MYELIEHKVNNSNFVFSENIEIRHEWDKKFDIEGDDLIFLGTAGFYSLYDNTKYQSYWLSLILDSHQDLMKHKLKDLNEIETKVLQLVKDEGEILPNHLDDIRYLISQLKYKGNIKALDLYTNSEKETNQESLEFTETPEVFKKRPSDLSSGRGKLTCYCMQNVVFETSHNYIDVLYEYFLRNESNFQYIINNAYGDEDKVCTFILEDEKAYECLVKAIDLINDPQLYLKV